MFIEPANSPLQKLNSPLLEQKHVSLYVKRDDLLHPLVSGNKWRKLKYNLTHAENLNCHTILSFGGAYSNHIYSLAAAGKIAGINTIGVIRGEEMSEVLNPTLKFASSNGMKLKFISRERFRRKYSEEFISELKDEFGDFFLLPEGGSNRFALPGCAEVVSEIDFNFNFICCPCGTGGTIAGICSALDKKQTALGFSALKAPGYIYEQVNDLLKESNLSGISQLQVLEDFHFGGYGKIKRELIEFMHWFKHQFHIETDPVYTGKMFYGIFKLIQDGFFPQGSSIVAVHTGGLQGLAGMKNNIEKILGK